MNIIGVPAALRSTRANLGRDDSGIAHPFQTPLHGRGREADEIAYDLGLHLTIDLDNIQNLAV